MAVNIPIWPGSGSFTSGSSTPFGYFDSDSQFQSDAPKVAEWCAKRLGYPIIDVELQDINFFTCLEEAANEYSSQVNQYRAKENLLSLESDFYIVPNINGYNLIQYAHIANECNHVYFKNCGACFFLLNETNKKNKNGVKYHYLDCTDEKELYYNCIKNEYDFECDFNVI